jgi:pyruvate formate lyase activating enzyme
LRGLSGSPPGGALVTGTVFDIRRYSIHDGPGIRTTVFLKGCALSCWWCHNPESQTPGPELVVRGNRCIRCGACVAACGRGGAALGDAGPETDRARCAGCDSYACAAVCYADAREVAGTAMSVAQVLEAAARDEPFYRESGGGVTLSGGEPLLQADFTLALLVALRARGIPTALDTCGHVPWAVLDRVRPHVDLFLYDVKLMDEERHRRFTGVSNRRILENLRALSERGHRIVLRLPIIPGVSDDEANVRAVTALAAGLPHLAGVDLLPYHRIGVDKYARLDRAYRLRETGVPSRARMDAIAAALAAAGLEVQQGGSG